MSRSIARLAAAAFLFLSSTLLLGAPGPSIPEPELPALIASRVELRAVPSFMQRLLVPLVEGAETSFQIENEPVTDVVEPTTGFRAVNSNGRLLITATGESRAGYLKVQTGRRQLTLTLLTMVPYSSVRQGRLDGYRIGNYEELPLRGLDSYRTPAGFIRLEPGNGDMWVSDHYRLRDFQCKLDGTSKFMVLRPEALIKLELMQQQLSSNHGVHFPRFTIMSGFRTPYYNSMIGNDTSYSRHLYGDAMDIYIDRNDDGVMDDINRDGRVDRHDALFLLKIAESIDHSSEWGWLKGGAGVYNANAAHGPYLHIDARGYVARWGV